MKDLFWFCTETLVCCTVIPAFFRYAILMIRKPQTHQTHLDFLCRHTIGSEEVANYKKGLSVKSGGEIRICCLRVWSFFQRDFKQTAVRLGTVYRMHVTKSILE